MTKQELIEFSPKEAFSHGKQMRKIGKSIHYNPYRNTDPSDASLFNAWILGWNS